MTPKASSRKVPDSENGACVGWVIVLWAVAAVAAVGVVTWALPRGRETRSAPVETKPPMAVSELTNLGNLAMREVESDPAAIDRALSYYRRGNAQDPGHLNARFGLAFAGQAKGLPDSEWRELYLMTVSEASQLAFLSLVNLAHAEQEAGRYQAGRGGWHPRSGGTGPAEVGGTPDRGSHRIAPRPRRLPPGTPPAVPPLVEALIEPSPSNDQGPPNSAALSSITRCVSASASTRPRPAAG